MKRFLFSGIRTQLILLFSIVLVPIAVLTAFNHWEQRKRAVERSQTQAEAIFELAVANEQAILQETQEILSRLSATPEIAQREGCADYLASVLKNHPQYVMFGIARTDGMVICSTVPIEGPVNLSDRQYFRKAIETGSFSIGTYQTERVTQRSTINYAYPILDTDKEIGGVVFTARDVSFLTEFETELFPAAPPGSSFAQIDGMGTVLRNYPDSPDLPTGKPLNETLFRKILSEKKGAVTLDGLDGVKRLYLFSTLWAVPFGEETYVLLGIPMESLLAEANQDLGRNLGVLGLAAAAMIVGLWFVGNHLIIRPVKRIVEASRRLAAGDLAARVGLPTERNELDHLGLVFDDMARELERKTSSLSAAESRLTHILSASPAVIFACPIVDRERQDQGFVPLFVSKNVREIFGYETREIMSPDSNWWKSTVHPEDLPRAMDLRGLFRRGKLSREYRVRLKDGSYRWVLEQLVLVRGDSNAPVETVGSWTDITERKKSEDALIRLSMAVDQAAEAIVITDTDANVEYANPAFERISGYSLDEVIGRSIRMLDGEQMGEKYYQEIWDSLKEGKVWRGRAVNRRKDGTFFEAEATVSPVWDASGKVAHYVSGGRDITREAALQKQVQNAQRLESVGVLAGGIAHDFNNALTGIFGFTEMAMSKAAGNEGILSNLNEIHRCAERASTLTRQLLAYSRRQIISPVNLNLNKIIADLMKLITKVAGEQITIRTVFEKNLPTVRADVGQIEQVFMNLVINSRDAMPLGGNLLIETGTDVLNEKSAVPYPGMKPGKYVVLTVSDTGIGMDEKTRERVFDPFFTTKTPDKGTGLGLAMVYGIVKQHEGFIGLQSELGKGTVFRIHLPVVEGTADEAVKTGPASIVGGTEVLLVAEDDEMVRAMAKETLEVLGYTVLPARNGKEAVELYGRERNRISLVLLDMAMPVMGGRDAYAEMVRRDPNLKAIFMSGYNEPSAHDSFARGLEAPFLPKPFTLNALARKVREVLDA